MEYYKLIFDEMPQINFAHSHVSEKYNIILQKRDIFEISYVEKGDIIKTVDKVCSVESFSVTAPCVTVASKGHAMTLKSESEHKHFTVGFSQFTQHEITSDDIINCYRSGFQEKQDKKIFFAVIPEVITDEKTVKDIARLIKLIISENNSVRPSRNMSTTAVLLELLQTVTEYSFGQVLNDLDVSFSDLHYCEKAISFIKNNLDKKLNIEEIADTLKISSGHLSRIFKKNTGKSIIEYINKNKIEYAQILLSSRNMSSKAVASQLSISDIKYFFHMFKRYTGMTINEYKNLMRQK